MNIEELELEELNESNSSESMEEFDEETYEKPWMDNPYEEEDDNKDPEDNEEEETEDDLISKLLKNKGIKPNSIKIEGEDGDIEEVDFYSLSPEEQLEILTYENHSDDNDLDDSEIDLINEIRSGNLTVDEYKSFLKQQAIQEYLNSTEDNTTYEVDSISDEELYILDLKSKIPDLTDEEANSELELAKQNESLFQKKIEGIRQEYKQKEDLLIKEEQLQKEEEYKKQQEEFENLIIQTLENNDYIEFGDNTLNLSEDDLNEIASFILDTDAAGVRYIAKALNDPKTLIGMSWYALKGREALNQISDYYKKEISKVAKENYTKGYDDAKSGKAANSVKTVVNKNKRTSQKQEKVDLTIDDLD